MLGGSESQWVNPERSEGEATRLSAMLCPDVACHPFGCRLPSELASAHCEPQPDCPGLELCGGIDFDVLEGALIERAVIELALSSHLQQQFDLTVGQLHYKVCRRVRDILDAAGKPDTASLLQHSTMGRKPLSEPGQGGSSALQVWSQGLSPLDRTGTRGAPRGALGRLKS